MLSLVLEGQNKPQTFSTELLEKTGLILNGYHLRIATSTEALVEKIRIFEAGLDDRVTRPLKLIAIAYAVQNSSVEGLVAQECKALFARYNDKQPEPVIEFNVFHQGTYFFTVTLPFELYQGGEQNASKFGIRLNRGEWQIV